MAVGVAFGEHTGEVVGVVVGVKSLLVSRSHVAGDVAGAKCHVAGDVAGAKGTLPIMLPVLPALWTAR